MLRTREVPPSPQSRQNGPAIEAQILASIEGELAARGLHLAVAAVPAIDRLPGGKRSTIVRTL